MRVYDLVTKKEARREVSVAKVTLREGVGSGSFAGDGGVAIDRLRDNAIVGECVFEGEVARGVEIRRDYFGGSIFEAISKSIESTTELGKIAFVLPGG